MYHVTWAVRTVRALPARAAGPRGARVHVQSACPLALTRCLCSRGGQYLQAGAAQPGGW